jgi:hypothetical protein
MPKKNDLRSPFSDKETVSCVDADKRIVLLSTSGFKYLYRLRLFRCSRFS